MPIQTRCPACAAAVPSNAAWCSLCHADLRPRPASSTAATVVPGRATIIRGPASTPAVADATPALADVGSGRHSRAAVPAPSGTEAAPAAVRARGRHSSGGRPATSVALDLDDLSIPAGADATPDQVDVLADQLLTRLALTEPRARMLDPDELPGGKWGFAAAATAGVVLLLLLVYTVLGLLFGR